MRLCVAYLTTVLVYVDTETEKVTRVVIADETAQPTRPSIVEHDDGANVIDQELRTKAIEIARDSDWPEWERD